jgi:hypothetical protein
MLTPGVLLSPPFRLAVAIKGREIETKEKKKGRKWVNWYLIHEMERESWCIGTWGVGHKDVGMWEVGTELMNLCPFSPFVMSL